MSGLSGRHLFVIEEICGFVGTDFVCDNIPDNAQGDAIDKPLAQPVISSWRKQATRRFDYLARILQNFD